MNSISTVLLLLLVIGYSCPLYVDKYCCDGEEFVNDCFVKGASKDPTLCQHNECLQEIAFNSSEWKDVVQYVSACPSDSAIDDKLLESGVRLNYGCSDHYRLKQAKKVKIADGINYYIKLQLLCDPLVNYAHVFIYLPPMLDSEGHVLFPHPGLMAIQYPKTEDDILDVFVNDDIIITTTSTDTPLFGNDKDEHGCIASAGYEWCDILQKCIRSWEEDCKVVMAGGDIIITTTSTDTPLFGNDKDEHGCIASAGYEWCDILQKCIKSWEEDCKVVMAGGDKDEHGCYASAGYSWCEVKNKCLRPWEDICATTERPWAGGDKDEHNCIPSAGFEWCESKRKCYKSWEEDCPDKTTTSVMVDIGDKTEGSGSMNLMGVRLQRLVGIIALFVILGIGIVVYCVAKKKYSENKSGNKNKINENSVSYENLL